MVQVRIFEGGDAEVLQETLNHWLKEHPELEIVRILQSEGAAVDREGDLCGNTTVSIFYKV
jgi:hypothetical protein